MNFLKQFISEPINTGAIAPSSKNLSQLIIKMAQLKPENVIVELGPGTGSFTKEILKEIKDTKKYFSIELNKNFVNYLKSKFFGIDIIHGSAEHIFRYLKERGHDNCDRVVSGLPWTSFNSEIQEKIISNVAESLSDNGLFLTFVYSPINLLPRGRLFKKKLYKHFKYVKRTKIVLNFPLAFVYICKK